MQNITFLPIDYRAQFVMIYHIGRGNNATPKNPKDCIMNKFCVGQKVIESVTRNLQTITAIYRNGKLVLDNFLVLESSCVECQEHYLDKTSFFYHHSKFGDGQQLASEAFRDYMSALEEMDHLQSYPGESAFLMKARTMCQEWIDNAAAKIEQGLTMKRTAEHNLAQWDGLTLDYHKPFLNPENLTNY